tara:strand:+ start:546 stop:689 length:144 start_codon:yes stop_codon:yes gene_type:complete
MATSAVAISFSRSFLTRNKPELTTDIFLPLLITLAFTFYQSPEEGER